MANQEHLDILAKGVEVWNEWRRELGRATDIIGMPDLSGGELAGANLRGANFQWVNASNANLRYAKLRSANLRSADLEAVDFRNADLSMADLSSAAVARGRLDGAILQGTTLIGTNLRYATLSSATLYETVLGNVDLSGAEGLDSCVHFGPSVIDNSTISKSGQLPLEFLRGCGVPENFITYMHSLTGAAFDFYSCFISYSTKDQDFADRLYADLQARGVRCWFAPHDIQGGRKLHEQVDEAIRLYDKLLLILSEASMNSEWVSTEISKARKRERLENRRMLFPISVVPYEAIRDWECFDADARKDSAREIREYFIPDFSNWKDHDSYQKAFNRLLRDLKANRGSKSAAAPE